MKAATKFTFKTEAPSGRFRSFESNYHQIKLNGHIVGQIADGLPFKVSLNVMKTETITDKNPNCPWKRISFKREFTSLQEAKDWLNTNFETLNKTYTIAQE